MVSSGPPCQTCGGTLRWFADINAWGCDTCRVTYPVHSPAHGRAGSGSRKAAIIIGAGVAVAGAVIAIVVATGSGSSGSSGSSGAAAGSRPHSREELAQRTFSALAAFDVPALEQLAGVADRLAKITSCPANKERDDEIAATRQKLQEHAAQFEQETRKGGMKDMKVTIGAFQGGGEPNKLPRGTQVSPGCTSTVDVQVHVLTVPVKINDGKDLESRLMALEVGPDWFLLDIGYVEGLLNDLGG